MYDDYHRIQKIQEPSILGFAEKQMTPIFLCKEASYHYPVDQTKGLKDKTNPESLEKKQLAYSTFLGKIVTQKH